MLFRSQRLNERDKRIYSSELMTEFQEEELKYASEIADTLGIPIGVCDSKNKENLIQQIVNHLIF